MLIKHVSNIVTKAVPSREYDKDNWEGMIALQ